MYFDSKHAFLIPMMENNILRGHAYVYKLDEVSKDSNSFMIQVFDEFLHDVGEKKLVLDSKLSFGAAIFNGTNIVTRFDHKQNGVRYMVFNQEANLIFDTTLQIKLRNSEKFKEENFQQTPMAAIHNQAILDYLQSDDGGTTLVSLGIDNKVWTYTLKSSPQSSMQLLAADNKLIVNTIYHYQKRKYFNDVSTNIQVLSAGGTKIAETNLFKNDSISIYPIAADIDNKGIEVISEYTIRAHEFSKVKFGICLHRFDLNGKLISEQYNDFTRNLVRDSLMKKYKLLVHSYLYMHKATRLKSGNWLVAAEQFQKTRMRSGLGRNKNIIYNKKNICLMEIDDRADLVYMHVEPNKPDGARLPRKYYRKPHNGSVVANEKGKLDFNYFIRNDDIDSERVSFVFTDGNYITQKLSLGNMVYKNGNIKVDRFVIPTFSSATRIAILPARFGHALLIKFDPYFGIFDFDAVKFNN